MSISGSTISRPSTTVAVDLGAPIALTDISCWRLLTARVPLTLLLDLALPSEDEFAGLYDELLAEPTSIDWVPNRTS